MANLSEDVALQVALAARALPDTAVGDLLEGILALVGEPLTLAKLKKIRLGKLKQLDCLRDIDETHLRKALAFLKDRTIQTESAPLPHIQAYTKGTMPGSIRVACASNSGEQIDGHFGSCARFLIYQVASDEIRLVDIRSPRSVGEDEDKSTLRAELLNDCQVLYTISIGGPAAAEVVRAGLHPIKLPAGGHALAVLERLQGILAGSPPPWLAKVMGIEPEDTVRFKEQSLA